MIESAREFYPQNVYVAYALRKPSVSLRQHPLVLEMIRLIPPTGAPWPKAQQALWLQTLANVFQILCPIPERISVTLDDNP